METIVVVETMAEGTIEEEDTKFFLYYCLKTISIEVVFLLSTILDF